MSTLTPFGKSKLHRIVELHKQHLKYPTLKFEAFSPEEMEEYNITSFKELKIVAEDAGKLSTMSLWQEAAMDVINDVHVNDYRQEFDRTLRDYPRMSTERDRNGMYRAYHNSERGEPLTDAIRYRAQQLQEIQDISPDPSRMILSPQYTGTSIHAIIDTPTAVLSNPPNLELDTYTNDISPGTHTGHIINNNTLAYRPFYTRGVPEIEPIGHHHYRFYLSMIADMFEAFKLRGVFAFKKIFKKICQISGQEIVLRIRDPTGDDPDK